MNMPGFTAEISLYRPSGHYQAAAHCHPAGSAVVTQATSLCTYGPCLPILAYSSKGKPFDIGLTVVGYGRQRCCCTYGTSTKHCSCSSVACPNVCLERRETCLYTCLAGTSHPKQNVVLLVAGRVRLSEMPAKSLLSLSLSWLLVGA